VPPDERPIPRHIAEFPREGLPYGRWEEALANHFLEACRRVVAEDDIGDPGRITWFPDRTYGGRTYVQANPDWALDLSDEVIGTWRGPQGRNGEIALVWGVALVENGAVATAELGPTTTDQCVLAEERFTLVSLDNYTGDYLEVKLWGANGAELAGESLYEDE
jgi:hypothetical protein